jgi:DNA-binding response OmpR family regulator
MDEVKSVQPRSTSEKHVLIVDDDRDMREMLSDCLRNNCFHATVVGDGTQARRQALRNKIDLAVVDLNLGREDGLNVVRDLAAQGIPVIIVTGNRVDEADKVVGLEIGAVDYLTKPFGVREFLARVRSKLRRRNDKGSNSRRRAYAFADFRLDLRKRRLYRDGVGEIQLSAGEFNLLTAFLRSPKQPLSREHLLNESRVHGEVVFDRSIDVLILRLRRKIEDCASRPRLIKTVRNAGYVLDADVTEQREHQ